jgi:endonuclease III
MMPDLEGALKVFGAASEYVIRAGLLAEVEWQRQLAFDDFTETDLLREYAWVILCSGFREQVVRQVFGHISLCFCDWESASAILDADPACRIAALASFRNPTKLAAIVRAALQIHTCGFASLKQSVLADPITELQNLPHIGPITARHLAKNLGLDVVKPDRHLARVSRLFGFNDADHFCTEIAKATGEQRKVIDLVVWRYIAGNPQFLFTYAASGRKLD